MKGKTEIMNSLNRTFGRAGLKLKKYSPEILVGAGIVGTVASAVMACKATTKISTILEDAKEQVDSVHYALENPEELSQEYTEEDGKKDLAIIYTQTGLKLVKTYGPAIVVGTLSIASILTGHNMLRKRYIATAAAYTLVDKSFKEYRGRVIERFGKELDRELKYNIKAKEYEEIVVNEDGTENVVKKTVEVADLGPGEGYSEYAKFFDETSTCWDDDAEFNVMFLNRQQKYATDLLRSRGHLFLNEVYDMLGIDRTKAGQQVGWIYDEKNPIGDNYVDFGIYETHRERNRAFVNGFEKCILLDFNVDGNILNMI